MDPSTPSQEKAVDPETWVDLYGDYLYRYAFSRLRDANVVEEVVQETFLAGIRYRKQFSGRGSERAWLLGILKRKIVDAIRLRAKFDRAVAYEEDPDPGSQLFDDKGNWRLHEVPWPSAVDQNVTSRELWGVVRECLGHLPPGQADVFTLSVMEEMNTDQICRDLRSVYSIGHAAKARRGFCRATGLVRNGRDDSKS